MPVTFNVSAHPANAMNRQGEYTAKDILAAACDDQYRKAEEILQFGFSCGGSEGRQFSAKMTGIVPQNNGFVWTLIQAYNQHHALVIRPDDVWLTILSQFNFFVNARAELLRANFVAHEGKKELIVTATGTRYDVDFGSLARQMVDLIDKNVVDPTLREWVLPRFTTTTANDTTVSAVLIMATLKAYFSYGFGLTCGIPRVTLEGEKADWVNILGRLEKLKDYGIETTAWYHLLRPVIARFVAAFDTPSSAENVDFWQRIAHHHAEMSGQDEYSGWITAFTPFNVDGKWIGNRLDLTAAVQAPAELMTSQQFWATYTGSTSRTDLVLDGTPYHRIDTEDVPAAYAEVDVKLDDNGEMFDCIMVGGLVGTQVTASGDLSLSATGKDDVVCPLSGWWIFTKKENPVTRQEEEAAELAKIMGEFEEKWGSASGPHTKSVS
ncbi:hypothetical protein C8F04DRAFT_583702 [Mycena alexandri]|uniref:DUF4419 domain-containing protein n=1 Tax=Mycena alexandri TaxID=1745969 RepID=A0AAD6X3H1_9AGAR|nr:hypothetical protein C8F04DRAFT_583702 [Mycena alexandri]